MAGRDVQYAAAPPLRPIRVQISLEMVGFRKREMDDQPSVRQQKLVRGGFAGRPMGDETDFIIPMRQVLDFRAFAAGAIDGVHDKVAIDNLDLDRRGRVPVVPGNPAANKILHQP
jgi:hypothetical protein